MMATGIWDTFITLLITLFGCALICVGQFTEGLLVLIFGQINDLPRRMKTVEVE